MCLASYSKAVDVDLKRGGIVSAGKKGRKEGFSIVQTSCEERERWEWYEEHPTF